MHSATRKQLYEAPASPRLFRWAGLLAFCAAISGPSVTVAQDEPSMEFLRERLEKIEQQQKSLQRENYELRKDMQMLEQLPPAEPARIQVDAPEFTIRSFDKRGVEWWP